MRRVAEFIGIQLTDEEVKVEFIMIIGLREECETYR